MSHNKWYTPSDVVEKVRAFYGGSIQLDVASCEYANRVVQADRYFTQEDNGLMQSWQAENVWCNPPFGKTTMGAGSNLAAFVRKADMEYRLGHAQEILLLIPVNTGTRWFNILSPYLMCTPDFRIRFYTEEGPSDGASFPTCFIYLGPHRDRFIEMFCDYGPIYQCIRYGKRYQEPSFDLWASEELATSL